MPSIVINHAKARSGSVSLGNSKMPGSTFALTTDACLIGGKLRSVPGSTCHRCYAISLERFRANVASAWTRNLERATSAIDQDPAAWSRDMAVQILDAARKSGVPFHRWFDGGDLQSLAMLEAIADVARLTPAVSHWLPTREAAMVKAYVKARGAFPPNLIVRVSSTMIDDAPLSGHAHTSTVHKTAEPVGHACPARHQGNACGACRACWTPSVANVSYPLH